jgi:hypothetical protein
MVSLTSKVHRLYFIIAVLFALCLTTITMTLYFVYFRGEKKETDKCIIIQQQQDSVEPTHKQVRSPPIQQQERDIRVLNDPLYPAYNRSEYDTHNSVVDAIERKQLYSNSRENNDRFRLVAYVSSSLDTMDAGGNKWKLLARNKNRNEAEFFLVPVDKNYDMKIMLNNDIIVGEKLRDVYSIPNQLTFKSPLLHDTPYDIVELPMTDFTSVYN